MIRIFFSTAAFILLTAGAVHAAPPQLQTPAPVIYLADNLDEKDNLGWCIDTLGRGWSDRLQTHSCKPQGGDVQFKYNKSTRQIMSAEFAGKCAELSGPAVPGARFGLLDCRADATQQFDYDSNTGEFRPAANGSLCLAAGEASRSAGPFMSRHLELAPCATTDTNLKRWVVKEGGA